MKTLKLTFHTDSGHGWLAVNRAHLESLGIVDQISTYSYQKGTTAYLEEDCDASCFFKAAKAAGWTLHMVENYKDRSPIRSYPHFSKKVPA